MPPKWRKMPTKGLHCVICGMIKAVKASKLQVSSQAQQVKEWIQKEQIKDKDPRERSHRNVVLGGILHHGLCTILLPLVHHGLVNHK
jgi:hypothetical protein